MRSTRIHDFRRGHLLSCSGKVANALLCSANLSVDQLAVLFASICDTVARSVARSANAKSGEEEQSRKVNLLIGGLAGQTYRHIGLRSPLIGRSTRGSAANESESDLLNLPAADPCDSPADWHVSRRPVDRPVALLVAIGQKLDDTTIDDTL